jgi:hypothetical protein
MVTDLPGGRHAALQQGIDERPATFMKMQEQQPVGDDHAVALASGPAIVHNGQRRPAQPL